MKKQLDLGLNLSTKKTRKREFLEEMERVVPWAVLVRVLQLPTPLFRLVAARMLRIDPQARSSMADDLALGRTTEIDALSGEVVRLATQLGTTAPLNEAIVERIHTLQR